MRLRSRRSGTTRPSDRWCGGTTSKSFLRDWEGRKNDRTREGLSATAESELATSKVVRDSHAKEMGVRLHRDPQVKAPVRGSSSFGRIRLMLGVSPPLRLR